MPYNTIVCEVLLIFLISITNCGLACSRILAEKYDFIKYIYNKAELLNLHRSAQIIFQDPYSSLKPRRSVGKTLAEPMQVHKLIPCGRPFFEFKI